MVKRYIEYTGELRIRCYRNELPNVSIEFYTGIKERAGVYIIDIHKIEIDTILDSDKY